VLLKSARYTPRETSFGNCGDVNQISGAFPAPCFLSDVGVSFRFEEDIAAFRRMRVDRRSASSSDPDSESLSEPDILSFKSSKVSHRRQGRS